MKSLSAPLDQRIADAIEEQIVSGRLAGGTRLRQDAIATEFGVSHIPVREAFRELAGRGYVELHARRGASVVHLRSRDIVELLEIRILLESAALRWAIPNISEADVRDAGAAITSAEHETNPLGWPALNWQFHVAIYRSCERDGLMKLIERLHADARAQRLHRLITHDIAASCKEHRRLLALIKKRDVDGAIALLERHIGVTSPQLKALLANLERVT